LADDVGQVFGANTLEYVMQLAHGQIDYLPRLSKNIIIHVVQFLELCDIATLAQVSKQFRRVTFTPYNSPAVCSSCIWFLTLRFSCCSKTSEGTGFMQQENVDNW